MEGLIDLVKVLVFLYFAVKVVKTVLFKGKKRKASIVGKLLSLPVNAIHHRVNMMLLRQRKYYQKQYLAQKENLEVQSDKNKVVKLKLKAQRS